jgi:hypothetical protein
MSSKLYYGPFEKYIRDQEDPDGPKNVLDSKQNCENFYICTDREVSGQKKDIGKDSSKCYKFFMKVGSKEKRRNNQSGCHEGTPPGQFGYSKENNTKKKHGACYQKPDLVIVPGFFKERKTKQKKQEQD